jgi:hypothetical protein
VFTLFPYGREQFQSQVECVGKKPKLFSYKKYIKTRWSRQRPNKQQQLYKACRGIKESFQRSLYADLLFIQTAETGKKIPEKFYGGAREA